MADIYLNGRFVPERHARISVLDRAVQLGDGLFETIRGHSGRPAFLKEHLERIRHSASFLKIPFRHTDDELRAIMIELCRRNGASEARIRLTLTRGVLPDTLSIAAGKPALIATAEPYTPHPPRKYEEGCSLSVSTTRLCSRSPLCLHKTLNYLEFLLAREEAARAGADEALLLNEKDNVAECSSANIFCVKRGEILTPDIASGILPGVVRAAAIRLSAAEGLRVGEAPLALEELLQAQEVFITSSLRGIMPVGRIGDKAFGLERPLTRLLSRRYAETLDAQCRDGLPGGHGSAPA